MAHEVETMLYVGETQWHGLGMSFPEGSRLLTLHFYARAAKGETLQCKVMQSKKVTL